MAFIKCCFFMRIYDGFSFLVQMMLGVFSDLKFFLAFYLLVLLLFAELFWILSFKLGEEYAGVGNFGYLLMSFRTSAGDFGIGEMEQN